MSRGPKDLNTYLTEFERFVLVAVNGFFTFTLFFLKLAGKKIRSRSETSDYSGRTIVLCPDKIKAPELQKG